MERLIFVTFSDDRYGRKNGMYGNTQDKVLKFLKQSNLGITDYLFLKFDDIINTEFYNKNQKMLEQSDPSMNGRCYKPYVILEGLKQINEGDYLIYNDVSPELWKFIDDNHIVRPDIYSLNVIKKLTSQNNDILTAYTCVNMPHDNENYHRHEFFTLNRCMKRMDLEQFKYSIQHASGFFCIKKTEKTIKFVEEWLYYNLIDECASLGFTESKKPQFWWEEGSSIEKNSINKVGHRHDQSISGLLINKMNNKLVVPIQNYYPTFNFLTFCLLNQTYSFKSTNLPKTKLLYNSAFNINTNRHEQVLVNRII
jgi:hypothetical protein